MQARGEGGSTPKHGKGGVHNMTGTGVSRRIGKTSGQEVMRGGKMRRLRGLSQILKPVIYVLCDSHPTLSPVDINTWRINE